MSVKEKKVVKFVGKCLYAQVFPGQERTPHKDQVKKQPWTANDRHYVITVQCSTALYKSLRAAGISRMVELKEVEGETYISIKGTKTKYSQAKDETYTFNDPEVVDANDNPMSIETLIGNGSKVEVTAQLADNKNGEVKKSLYLEKVKVLDLVPYEKPEVVETVVFEDKPDVSNF